jgi:membrane protease YdiL (CAAX protease family)
MAPLSAMVVLIGGHALMLGTALRSAGAPVRAVGLAVGLLVIAGASAAAHPVASAAFLAVPCCVARLAVAGELRALGLGTPCPRGALALGALAGTFLGAHVLVSAMLTAGYRIRVGVAALPLVLYDVGAQVLATELFFRGFLFNRAQRRWSFGAAVALTTAASAVRYLVDPLLPDGVEIVVGTLFYVCLLGVVTSALLWRFGTLVPGLVASTLFFAAYRLLGLR